MPLYVNIKVNTKGLSALKISRLEPFMGEDKIHVYDVTDGAEWTTFEHLYSDGHQTCVEKALAALRKMREEKRER